MCDCEKKESGLSEAFSFLTERAASDLKLGIRSRNFMARVRVIAQQNNLDPDAAVLFVRKAGLPPTVDVSTATIPAWLDGKQTLASSLGVDWTGLINFMNALVPIIEQFMASCPTG